MGRIMAGETVREEPRRNNGATVREDVQNAFGFEAADSNHQEYGSTVREERDLAPGATVREVREQESGVTVREGDGREPGATIREGNVPEPGATVREPQPVEGQSTVREDIQTSGAATIHESPRYNGDMVATEGSSAGARIASTALERGRFEGATQLENSARSGYGTSRGGVRAPHSRIRFPQAIDRDYEWIRDFDPGAESDVALMRAKATGREVVVKLYRGSYKPNSLAMAWLRGADKSHVVEIVDYHTGEDGTWEIQEYCPFGSLRDWAAKYNGRVPEALMHNVVLEISTALAHMQNMGSGMAHRDLKPANILVRSEDPLDLVLADFGLTEMQGVFTHFTQHIQGTWHYAAPEVYQASVSPRSDWFSFGVIVYEYLTGRPLFSNEDGAPEPDDVARYRCVNKQFNTTLVPEGRWRDLVDGLLCCEREYRWVGDEVQEWLNGGSPHVHERHEEWTSAGSHRFLMLEATGEILQNPADLLRAIRENWDIVIREISGRKADDYAAFLEQFPRTDLAVSAMKSAESQEWKLFQVQLLLDSETDPVYCKVPFNTNTLRDQIARARIGEQNSVEWLKSIVDNGVLQLYGVSRGNRKVHFAGQLLSEWKHQKDDIAHLAVNRKDEIEKAFTAALPEMFSLAFGAERRDLSQR